MWLIGNYLEMKMFFRICENSTILQINQKEIKSEQALQIVDHVEAELYANNLLLLII
jgi:hypothetical protein